MSDPTSMPTPSESNGRDTHSDEGEAARARAVLSRFIAACFSGADALRAQMTGPALRSEVQQACLRARIAVDTLDALFGTLADIDALRDARDRLLGHSVRSDCPPYELEYCQAEVFQQSQTLADIAGFYNAFGLQLDGPLAERHDHLVAEWEFLCILAFREFQASRTSDAPSSEICRDAQRAFLRDHAARWMPAFFTRVRSAEPGGPLAPICDLADALLRAWCDTLGVTLGAQWIELRDICEDDVAIRCGAPDAGQVELGPTLAAAAESRGWK